MSRGYVYILECSDGSYYTGSTVDLELRFAQHQIGEGSNYTKKRLPVKLMYYEEFERVDEAFYREKQVQGWSRKKKEALIENRPEDLPLLASTSSATNKTSSATKKNTSVPRPVAVVSTSSTTNNASNSPVPEPVEGTDIEIQKQLKGLRYV